MKIQNSFRLRDRLPTNRKKWLKRTAVLALLVSFPVLSARAAIDVFLKLTDKSGNVIKGDSTDKAFNGADGWFEISSFEFGIQNSVTIGSGTGGAGAGKAAFQDLKITKHVDSTSPKLFTAAAKGERFATAKLVIRHAGITNPFPPGTGYFEMEMKMVYVSKQSFVGYSGDDQPNESDTFQFGAVKLNYTGEDAKGGLKDPVSAMWSAVLNDDVFEVE